MQTLAERHDSLMRVRDVARDLDQSVSAVYLAAALFSLFPAAAWKWLACENESTEACGRKELADFQFVVASIGVAPAILLVWDTVRGNGRACVWLGIGLTIYVGWAVLLDAAIHGWDDLRLLHS